MSEPTTETVVETPTETTTEQEAFTKEKVETMISEATKKANKEAETFRLKLKAIEEEAANKKLQESTDLEELKKTLETTIGENKTYKEKLEAFEAAQEAEFTKLLEKVPEKLKAHLDESIPLSKRLAMARDFVESAPSAPNAGLPGETGASTYEDDIKAAKNSKELQAVLEKHGRA